MDNLHYVTPEEAKEKICPLKPNQMSIWCEGPKCMAWRWAKITDYNHLNPTEKFSATHGYCGMVRNG